MDALFRWMPIIGWTLALMTLVVSLVSWKVDQDAHEAMSVLTKAAMRSIEKAVPPDNGESTPRRVIIVPAKPGDLMESADQAGKEARRK